MIELTDVELFKDLTLIEQDGNTYDLHNDYDCIDLSYDKESESINIVFEKHSSKSLGNDKICLLFKNVTVAKFYLFFIRTEDTSTINSFYRGKFENDGELFERSSGGAGYFYIEFEKGDKFEFFSKKVLLLEI
jgi:hypothetical protein